MDDDDNLQLPSDTLAALAEFHAERDVKAKQFEQLQAQAESDFAHGTNGTLNMDLFGEDWNASQFWYNDATANVLARQLLHSTPTEASAIAVVSAPSVYVALRNILAAHNNDDDDDDDDDDPARGIKPKLCLLEFDRRFEVVGSDFTFYDFQNPLRLPADLQGKFDRIICDPPFLSQDCQTKTALTVRFLARSWEPGAVRFISCTGERMEPTILRLYRNLGVQTTTFEPEHSKGLSNEFRCFANFECGDWTWREETQ